GKGEGGGGGRAGSRRGAAPGRRHRAAWHCAGRRGDRGLGRDNLGHVSLTTTSQYLHADDDWRHRETEEKHRIGW
ncbi:integrase, partial [Burkholderia contaminans]